MSRNPFSEWLGLDELGTRLATIEQKLEQVLSNQTAGKEMIMAEKEEIENLVTQVRQNRDVVSSATTALQGLVAAVAQGQQELANAIANNTDVSPDIRAAADELKADTDALKAAVPALASAVTENTPAAK
jgi:chromosome segregation ATPase